MDDNDIRPYSSLAFNAQSPATKSDLIAALPTRIIVDRFVSRYFNSNSPSLREWNGVQNVEVMWKLTREEIMHRPSFQRAVSHCETDPWQSTY